MGGNLVQTKIIQTKVVLGKGAEEFFKEADFEFPMGKELFKIEKINKVVKVTDVKVVGGNKVIFNAVIIKNIAYKTAKCVDTDYKDDTVTVTGDIVHITKKIPFAGCIDIKPEYGCKLNEDSFAEVLEAEVIGEVEELLCPMPVKKHPPYPVMDGLVMEGKEEEKLGGGDCYKPRYEKCEEEPVLVYKRLHEKMCIKIKVKVVAWEHFPVRVAVLAPEKDC